MQTPGKQSQKRVGKKPLAVHFVLPRNNALCKKARRNEYGEKRKRGCVHVSVKEANKDGRNGTTQAKKEARDYKKGSKTRAESEVCDVPRVTNNLKTPNSNNSSYNNNNNNNKGKRKEAKERQQGQEVKFSTVLYVDRVSKHPNHDDDDLTSTTPTTPRSQEGV